MYDILTSQFNDVLAREGKTITSSTGNTYQCVFRKNSDKNNSDNRLTIFYPATESIAQGQLLKFKDNYFLSLNQETIENDVYKKSDLLEADTEIHTITSGYELYIKAYAEDATSLGVTGNSTITTVGGNISFIAQDDTNSRRLAIDATFTALGGTWKITNVYYKCGLCYIFTSRTANSATNPTYALSVTGGDTCTMTESTQMTATATITDSGTTTTILNPTIEWTSSDANVATVSSTGLVTGVSAGTATITAHWVEHDVTATKAITIKSNVVITYTAAITPSGSTTIATGRSKLFTAAFTDSTGAAASLTPAWTLNLPSAVTGYVTMTYPDAVTAKVAVANNEDICGYTFTLTLKDSNNLCSASVSVEIT